MWMQQGQLHGMSVTGVGGVRSRRFGAAHLALLGLIGCAAWTVGRLAADEDAAPVQVHGFFLADYAARTTGERPAPAASSGNATGDYPLAEERLRVELSAADPDIDASAHIKADFYHDDLASTSDLDMREAYVNYTWQAFDFRLGRQMVTWGAGDLLFINDVFPKDWVSFFTGRPLEYMKVGVDGVRVNYSSDRINLEALAIPIFQPDIVPTSDRFFFYDPFAAVTSRSEVKPDARIDHTELALRVYRHVGDFDLSLYTYRGYWRDPSGIPDSFVAPTQITLVYPTLTTAGASVQGNALSGVVSLEAGYYWSRQDLRGNDPTIPNSQARFLIGYQRQPWQDGTIEVQYYAEIMQNYSQYRRSMPAGMPKAREYRDVATLRFDQYLSNQAWRLSLMCFYSPADDDELVQPSTSYKLSDHFSAAVGANIFGGRHHWT
ncbi:MAG: DUF1302 family protein [Planctomycetota bacterium]